MRITKYGLELNENKMPYLIKMESVNIPELTELNSPILVYDLLNKMYRAKHLAEEYVWVIGLNSKCKVLGVFELSHGSINYSIIQTREIFVRLCLCGASNFILAHNHPSGIETPSTEDVTVTKKIKGAGELMSISLTDHIIVGDKYFSFKENNYI